jgi:cupin 2 domain-containing protein
MAATSDRKSGNLFADLPDRVPNERFTTLLDTGGVTVERIVSTGQATPAGEWDDQPRAEWVVLLKGAAGLRFEDERTARTRGPGDYVFNPAHARHRVEWTSDAEPTVWLAVHLPPEQVQGARRNVLD